MDAERYIEEHLESGQLDHGDIADLARAFQLQNHLLADGKPGRLTKASVQKALEYYEGLCSSDVFSERSSLAPLPSLTLAPSAWCHGIDLDHHQALAGDLNAEEVGFAWVGATEGTRGRASVDPMMLEHLERLGEVTKAVGIYHFARPSSAAIYGPHSGQPRGEAENFARQWERAHAQQGALLPPVLDIEDEKEQVPKPTALIEWCDAWCEHCKLLTGRDPIIYTYFSYIHVQLKGCIPVLGRYPLWLADYRHVPPAEPREIPGWSWLVWQYTGKGRVSGVRGAVDRNVFRGTREQLLSLVA